MTYTINPIFNNPIFNYYTQPNNPHNIPHTYTLWENIINQHFTPDYIREKFKEFGDGETSVNYLLSELYNYNRLYLVDPLTGEIIFHLENNTNKIYLAVDFFLHPYNPEINDPFTNNNPEQEV